MTTLSDLDGASELILQRATAGKLGLSEAHEIFNLIENRRRILVAQELDRRLSVLENGGGAPKRFEGTMEDLLKLYRQTTLESAEEEGGRRTKPASSGRK